MNQHISQMQAEELTEEHRMKLFHWWDLHHTFGSLYMEPRDYDEKPRKYEKVLAVGFTGSDIPSMSVLPILSIGEMIGFLESKKPTLHITKHLKQGMQKEDRYDVFQQGAGSSRKETLCDALWESVKKALSENPQ